MKIDEALLTPNKYSRPQIPLKKVTKIAVHYVGNPNTSAKANRNYFENQKNGGRYVSSHFIVGLSGEILQCIPTDEISYCTNQANTYSISIECCHPDSTGKFNAATESFLAELCAYLCKKYSLDPTKDIIRHYDVTGKQCPLYWSPTKYQPAEIANARFLQFKERVKNLLAENNKDEENFRVRILDAALNIRKAPGILDEICAVIKDKGVYTIVETASVGSATWGRLKSGAGWINIGKKYCEVIK